MTPGYNSAEQIDKAHMLMAKLVTVKASREPQDINESLTNYLALLQDLSDGKNPAMATGIGGLDDILNGGLRLGEMLVLGHAPSTERLPWRWPSGTLHGQAQQGALPVPGNACFAADAPAHRRCGRRRLEPHPQG